MLKSIPEFCTLRCLLRASPTYYRTYTSFQQEILITIVSRQFIQGTAADVVAALISVDFFYTYDTRMKEEASVEVLMDEYLSDIGKSNLSQELYRDGTGKISLSSLQKMRIVRVIYRIQIYAYVFY